MVFAHNSASPESVFFTPVIPVSVAPASAAPVHTAASATLSGRPVPQMAKVVRVVVKKPQNQPVLRHTVVKKQRGVGVRITPQTGLLPWDSLMVMNAVAEFTETQITATSVYGITMYPTLENGDLTKMRVTVEPTGQGNTIESIIRDVLQLVTDPPEFFNQDSCMDAIKNKTTEDVFKKLAAYHTVVEIPTKCKTRKFDRVLKNGGTVSEVAPFDPGLGAYPSIAGGYTSELQLRYNSDGSTPTPVDSYVRLVPLKELDEYITRNVRLALSEKYKICLYCTGTKKTSCKGGEACWAYNKIAPLEAFAKTLG
jgi:hypothetical protein